LLENAGTVVEYLIAELRNGHRTPSEVPPNFKDLGLGDGESLEQLLQELHVYNRAGRLSDEDLDALCLMLDRASSSTRDGDDLDPTVELEASCPPSAQQLREGRSATPVELRRGSVLRDRYVLGEPVGSGGLSVVFRARDLRRDAGDTSGIAIKVLRQAIRASGPANARLKREFGQTQALRHHPGTVRMFDLDCDGDTWFITMERLVGTSLDARLKELPARTIDMADAMRIASACADVLAFAHQQGVLHGDFKPGNVFLEDSGTVKVLDFGTSPASPQSVVDVVSGRASVPRAVTRAYASPEVLAGEAAEPRDDVFSLTCVVYELLSGRHPFGRLPANKARDLSLAATPLPHLSSAQNAALVSGLAWSRAERPATVQEFMRLLMSPAIEPEPQSAQARSPNDRRPWRFLGVLVATTVLVFALWQVLVVEDREVGTDGVEDTRTASGPTRTGDAPIGPTPAELVSPSAEERPAPSTTIAQVLRAEEPPLPAATIVESSPGPPRPRPSTPVATRERTQVSADRASIVVSEGTHAAVILLRRQANLAASVQVTWRVANGNARLQEDFDGPATGTIRFLRDQTTRALYVPLINDTLPEGEESFSLQLASRSAAIGPTGEITITIVDDDQ
jgi:serine/threonine protein kinase